MTDVSPQSLPALTYLGGTTAMTATPMVGTPAQSYPEIYVPREEPIQDGENARLSGHGGKCARWLLNKDLR